MADMGTIIEKSAKLGASIGGDSSAGTSTKSDVAYIRQDKILATNLKERHASMLSELDQAFTSKDSVKFSESVENLTKMGEVMSEANDENASIYLSSFNDVKDGKNREAELSSITKQVNKIEIMLEKALASKSVKLGASESEKDEVVEKKLFDELKTIVEKLESSHSKYGDK